VAIVEGSRRKVPHLIKLKTQYIHLQRLLRRLGARKMRCLPGSGRKEALRDVNHSFQTDNAMVAKKKKDTERDAIPDAAENHVEGATVGVGGQQGIESGFDGAREDSTVSSGRGRMKREHRSVQGSGNTKLRTRSRPSPSRANSRNSGPMMPLISRQRDEKTAMVRR